MQINVCSFRIYLNENYLRICFNKFYFKYKKFLAKENLSIHIKYKFKLSWINHINFNVFKPIWYFKNLIMKHKFSYFNIWMQLINYRWFYIYFIFTCSSEDFKKILITNSFMFLVIVVVSLLLSAIKFISHIWVPWQHHRWILKEREWMKTISDMAGRTDKTITWTVFVFFMRLVYCLHLLDKKTEKLT